MFDTWRLLSVAPRSTPLAFYIPLIYVIIEQTPTGKSVSSDIQTLRTGLKTRVEVFGSIYTSTRLLLEAHQSI